MGGNCTEGSGLFYYDKFCANNGNPFGAADYAKNRNRILETGIDIWEYEGGYSYHGKVF